MKKEDMLSFDNDIMGPILAKLVSLVEGEYYCYKPIEIMMYTEYGISYTFYLAKAIQLETVARCNVPNYNDINPNFSYKYMSENRQIVLLCKEEMNSLNMDDYSRFLDSYLTFTKDSSFSSKDDEILPGEKNTGKNTKGTNNASEDNYFDYIKDFLNLVIFYAIVNKKTKMPFDNDGIPVCTMDNDELTFLLEVFIIQNKSLIAKKREAKLEKVINDFYEQRKKLKKDILGDLSLTRKKPLITGEEYE